MPTFEFLSTAEFERLSPADRLTYLSEAMEELDRLKLPRAVRGWHSLFSRPQQQQQQHQQSQPSPEPLPGRDPEPPPTS